MFCFFVWIDFFGILVLNSNHTEQADKFKASGRSINSYLDSLLGLIIVGVLIYFGWYITAIAAFFTEGFKASFYNDLHKL